MMSLTASMENYLKAICILKRNCETVRCVDIAHEMGVSLPSVSRAVETPFGDFPEWGESIERITTKRHIIRHVREESLSLLFNVPVQTMLARETVEKQESTVLYSFLDNKLIEYVLHLEYGSADIYDATKTHLEMLYEKYTGTLFSDNKDVFVDKKGKTGILLLKNETEGIFLYFLDMEAYTAIKEQP